MNTDIIEKEKIDIIVKLCKGILENNIDIVEAVRKIKLLNYRHFVDTQGFNRVTNFIKNEEASNFWTLLEDETDTIPKGSYRNNYTKKYLKVKEQEEKKICKFYEKEIPKYAKKTIEVLEELKNYNEQKI